MGTKIYDYVIVGGGASGTAAAISLYKKNNNTKICILEKNDEICKKIFATGNGKCNITNTRCENYDMVKKFLENIGIEIIENEEGRCYPLSLQASAVVDIFKTNIKNSSIEVKNNSTVLGIYKESENFFIKLEDKKNFIESKNIIIATGGKSGPQWGCTGDGYKLAKKFGHKVIDVRPALTNIKVKNLENNLKGVRANCKVSLYKESVKIDEEIGEIQFAQNTLSGICIFNLSDKIIIEKEKDKTYEEKFSKYSVAIELLPEKTENDVKLIINSRKKNFGDFSIDFILKSILNDKIATVFLGILKPKSLIKEMTDNDIEVVVKKIKKSKYIVEGTGSWKESQVTAGGIPLSEINIFNMESNLCKGLYFVGEIIDWQGKCGGYNLNFAWSTAIKCGEECSVDI